MRLALILLLLLAACSSGRAPGAAPSAAPALAPRGTSTPMPSPVPSGAPDPFALARSLEASDPETLAASLTSAERAIHSDASDFSAHARIQQALVRQLVRMPEWQARAFDLIPDDLEEDVRANVRAGAELRALTEPRDQLPPWRIVAPPSVATLHAAYDRAAKAFGIDWTFLAAIHLSETRMGRIRGTSTAGAKGPMQFLPQTWAAYGEGGDIEDPDDAIMAAARYLHANGAPGNMAQALYAYNHSQHYVRAITLYAQVMRRDPRTYRAYHEWQVYYRTTTGDALLYEGWPTR